MEPQKLTVSKKVVTIAIVESDGAINLKTVETAQKERFTEKQAKELFPDAKKLSILSTEKRKYELMVDGQLIEQLINEQYPKNESEGE